MEALLESDETGQQRLREAKDRQDTWIEKQDIEATAETTKEDKGEAPEEANIVLDERTIERGDIPEDPRPTTLESSMQT